MYLLNYGKTCDAECTARPSKICKSPYVADITLENTSYLAHSPALGMDGYIANGKRVLVSKIEKPTGSCVYKILAAFDENKNIYVGANPLHANRLFHEACKNNLFIDDFGEIFSIVPEYTHGDSRFDFFINDSIYVEVKSVLIEKNNTAIFPVGNKKKGTISERANKHVSELTTLAKSGQSCAIVFMVLREDVDSFQTNPKDELFSSLIKNAYMQGVQVLIYQFKVDEHGISFMRKLNYT